MRTYNQFLAAVLNELPDDFSATLKYDPCVDNMMLRIYDWASKKENGQFNYYYLKITSEMKDMANEKIKDIVQTAFSCLAEKQNEQRPCIGVG